jgi:hypothetical protein
MPKLITHPYDIGDRYTGASGGRRRVRCRHTSATAQPAVAQAPVRGASGTGASAWRQWHRRQRRSRHAARVRGVDGARRRTVLTRDTVHGVLWADTAVARRRVRIGLVPCRTRHRLAEGGGVNFHASLYNSLGILYTNQLGWHENDSTIYSYHRRRWSGRWRGAYEARVATDAAARVCVDSIHALSTVLARHSFALIDVLPAVRAGVSQGADARSVVRGRSRVVVRGSCGHAAWHGKGARVVVRGCCRVVVRGGPNHAARHGTWRRWRRRRDHRP